MAAEFDVGHNEGVAELIDVGFGRLDGDGGGAEEDAVAVGEACGGVAAEGDGDDGIAEESDEPADRTDKALRLTGAPVHVFGPIEGG